MTPSALRRLAIAVTAVAVLGAAGVASAAGLGVTSTRLTTFAVAGIAEPLMTGMTMQDQNADGWVDTVAVTFDAAVSTTNLSDWTLTNVPSGATLLSATPSGNQVLLALGGGAGAPDTAAGSFTVALADTTGTLTSFGPTAPADGAGPVPIALSTTNAGTAGRMEAGDTLAVTFSEDLEAASVPSSTSVSHLDDGTGLDFLNATGITAGYLSLGSPDYLHARGKEASFANSMVSRPTADSFRVTVAGVCSAVPQSSCDKLTPGQGSFTYLPAPAITDAAGNAAAGSLTTAPTFRLF